MRRHYANLDGDALARERDADERTHGAGSRPWDPEPERHETDCYFEGEPIPTGKPGPLAYQLVCMAHGRPIFGRDPERCKAHAAGHVRGEC